MADAALLKQIVHAYSQTQELEWVRTGIHPFDLLLGNGIPVGRTIELYGPESGGKSLMAWHAAKAFQEQGGVAVLYDVEATAPKEYMRRVGVNHDLLITRRDRRKGNKGYPYLDTIESIEDDILHMMDVLRTATQGPILFIWDSIAATSCDSEWEEAKEGDKKVRVPTTKGYMADRAWALSQAFRRLTPKLYIQRATLLAVNQIRNTLAMYGKKTDSPGGRSMKHHASVRVEMTRLGRIQRDDKYVGVDCRLRVEKNKVAEPFREAETKIFWDRGFDPWSGLGEVLVQAGRLGATGRALTYKWDKVIVGQKGLSKLVAKQKELLDPWY